MVLARGSLVPKDRVGFPADTIGATSARYSPTFRVSTTKFTKSVTLIQSDNEENMIRKANDRKTFTYHLVRCEHGTKSEFAETNSVH